MQPGRILKSKKERNRYAGAGASMHRRAGASSMRREEAGHGASKCHQMAEREGAHATRNDSTERPTHRHTARQVDHARCENAHDPSIQTVPSSGASKSPSRCLEKEERNMTEAEPRSPSRSGSHQRQERREGWHRRNRAASTRRYAHTSKRAQMIADSEDIHANPRHDERHATTRRADLAVSLARSNGARI